MRRSLAIVLTGGVLLLASLLLASGGATLATIAPTTTCSNGVDDTGGLGLICQVTVVNTITATGGTARVTVKECHGAAGAPEAACTVTTQNLTQPVTKVTQCNGSINGGGGTLRCSVRVKNHFVDLSPDSTAVTVNQCVGSGGGITTGCDPYPATTLGAMVTQCNGSANGGTLVGMTCTVTGQESSAHSVKINQCNGSANGGGSLVICWARITNKAVSSGPSPTPRATPSAKPTASPGGTPGPTPKPTPKSTPAGPTPAPNLPPTNTLATTDGSGPSPFVPIFVLALVVALAALGLRLRSVNRAKP